MTFFNWEIIGSREFIGLGNYKELFSDTLFWKAFKNTLYYLVLVGPFEVILGLLLASLVNQPLRGKVIARTLVFMPYVIMVTAVGIVWRWILETRFGILNYYFHQIGLPEIPWLTDSRTAMPGIVFTTIWWTVGFNMVIFLAGLQDIPQELYEASRIDGAKKWQQFYYITIPLLRPAAFFVILTTIIFSLQVFGQIFVMTSGGPGNSTLVLVQYLYMVGFRLFRLGYASTIGFVLFLIILIFSLLQFRFVKMQSY
jgi:multiple sugar transport system permease protein